MRHLPVILVTLACAACTVGPTSVVSNASPAPALSAASPLNPPVSLVGPVQLGGLTFGLPTADDLRAAVGFGFTGTYILNFRPSIHGAGSTARQLENGNFELHSYLPSPFGDAWGTASVLSAHVPAPDEQQIEAFVELTVRPLLQVWAPDGALYTNYARMPNLADQRAGITRSHDPNATTSEAAILKNVGWPLAYVSESRHEALFFYAAGVVLRVQWSEKRFTEANVPVPAKTAIQTLVAALRDPTATSEESRTGLDHFLGVPFAGVFGPPAVNRHDDLVPTYEIPDAIDWSAFLGTEYSEKPVWFVNSTWGGGGLVDALTGSLIRFTRLRVGHGTGGPPTPFAPPAP